MSRNYRYEQFLSQITSKFVFGRDIDLTDEEVEELSGLIKKASKTPRHEIALRNFYGLDCERVRERKIAEKFGVSTTRVRQLRVMTVSLLRGLIVKERKFVSRSSAQKEVMESISEEIRVLKDKIKELQNRTRPDRLEVNNRCNEKVGELLKCVPVDALDLSVRTSNCLKETGIETLGQLISKGSEDLFEIRNFGKPCLKEVERKLAIYGLALKK